MGRTRSSDGSWVPSSVARNRSRGTPYSAEMACLFVTRVSRSPRHRSRRCLRLLHCGRLPSPPTATVVCRKSFASEAVAQRSVRSYPSNRPFDADTGSRRATSRALRKRSSGSRVKGFQGICAEIPYSMTDLSSCPSQVPFTQQKNTGAPPPVASRR